MALPFVGEIRASSFHPSFDETANKKQRSSLIAPLPILSVPFTLEPDRITYSIIQFLYNRIPSRSSFLNDNQRFRRREDRFRNVEKPLSQRSILSSLTSKRFLPLYIYIYSRGDFTCSLHRVERCYVARYAKNWLSMTGNLDTACGYPLNPRIINQPERFRSRPFILGNCMIGGSTFSFSRCCSSRIFILVIV